MTIPPRYFANSFPDQIPRQRRRLYRDDEATVEEAPPAAALSVSPTSLSMNTAAATGASIRRSGFRRIKRSRSLPLAERLKSFLSLPARRYRRYAWYLLYIIVVGTILHRRFLSGSDSSLRRMRRSMATNDKNRHLASTGSRNYGAVVFMAPSRLQFAFSLGRYNVSRAARDLYADPSPDYASLDFHSLRFLASSKYRRHIHPDSDEEHEDEKIEQLLAIDRPGLDLECEPFADLDYHPDMECHRLQWVDELHPTCNNFHEYVLLDRDAERDALQSLHQRYLAHGYFRDAWLLEQHELAAANYSMVLKTLRVDREFSIETAATIYKEVLIMERMSASPRIMNLYSHCYTSMLVEHGYEISQRIVQGVEYNGRGRIQQEVLDQEEKEGVKPRNNFTIEEKLEIALAMAEGIAMLHGHPEGLIINDDVHPDQWLITADGEVKFNDFNNAHILEWNPRNNSYCKYHIWIGGDYRSPEEEDGRPIDEKSDVWPLGANIFVLLSGLYPYYTIRDAKLIESIIANGTRPYLDPRYKRRSFIEAGMYDIMQECFEVDPEKRVDIFTVVRQLRSIKEAVQRGEGGSEPYDADVVLRRLANNVVAEEKEKQSQKEIYLKLHGSLDGFNETSTYGEYGAQDGDDGDDDDGD